jgi:hypothetical protein
MGNGKGSRDFMAAGVGYSLLARYRITPDPPMVAQCLRTGRLGILLFPGLVPVGKKRGLVTGRCSRGRRSNVLAVECKEGRD